MSLSPVARFLLALSPLVFGAVACTASTDATSTQCRSQDDCLSRGPEFAGTTCSLDRVCVKLAVVEKGCTTNRECIERNGGAPYTCRKNEGKCVSLFSNECPSVFGKPEELLDDNTVYVGASGPVEINGTVMSAVLEYARNEFMVATRGLPPLTPGGPRRPVVAIFCNQEALLGGGTIDSSIRQAEHIADIGSPVFLGGLTANAIIPMLSQRAIPRGLTIFTSSALGAVTDLPSQDQIFRVRVIDTVAKPLVNPIIQQFEARAVTDGVKQAGEPLRVAIVRSQEPSAIGQMTTILSVLNFNNKDAKTNLDEGTLKVFDIGNPGDTVGQPDAYQKIPAVVVGTQTFAPHVILQVGSPPNIAAIFRPLMSTWPAGTPIPYTFAFLDSWTSYFAGLAGPTLAPPMSDVVRKRYLGVLSFPRGVDEAKVAELNVAVGLFKPELANSLSGNSFVSIMYDAFYLFVYSATAIGNEPLVGANLPKGARKLGSGEPINFGTTDLPRALQILQNGGSITYNGAFGSYAFDEKGNRPGIAEVICVGPPPARPIVRTGYQVDTGTNTFSGTFSMCP